MQDHPVLIVKKKSADLSAQEIDQMSHIIRELVTNLDEQHIYQNHIRKNAPDFCMMLQNGKIVAFQSYSCFTAQTPFRKKPIPVIYSGLLYKDKETRITSVSRKLSQQYLRKQLGMFWFMNPFIITTTTVSPRMVFELSQTFKTFYPLPGKQAPEKIQSFLTDIYHQYIHKPLAIDGFLVNDKGSGSSGETDITGQWEKMYASRNPDTNDFFIRSGIIAEKDHRYFLTGSKNLVICMMFDPFRQLLKS